MKKVKEIALFFLVCYISCFITNFVIDKFVFNTSLLIDSLFIAFGCTIGWIIVLAIKEKIK